MGHGQLQDVSGQIHFNSATIANLDTQSNTVSFNSAIGGVGGLNKLGSTGVLVLTANNNSYTGGTTVTAGSLVLTGVRGAGTPPATSAGR